MSVNKHPFLPRHYKFLPMNGSMQVIEFWSNMYEGSGNDTDLTVFSKRVAAYMRTLGYKGDTDGTADVITFSGGIIGVGREMLVFHTHRAGVTAYFKPIQDCYYVSLRMVYYQPLSLLRMLCFALVVCGLTLFRRIQSLPMWFDHGRWYGGTILPSTPEELYYQIEHVLTPPYLSATVELGVLIALGLLLIGGVISWWHTGHFLRFLREDFQEIYRDDVASIGQAAYIAILRAADDLSLEAIGLPEHQPGSPTLAFSPRPEPTQRRRI